MNSSGDGVWAKLIATWGLLQVSALLCSAIYRLAPLAAEPWQTNSLSPGQQLLFVGWMGVNLYAEGYRGFQLRFSPRVVARAAHLGRNPRPLHVLLALPFCMSLFHAQRRQRMVSWIFMLGLIVVVTVVRALPQPWRGIIDGGVVVGLGYGVGSLWWLYGRYLFDRQTFAAPDLPAAATPAT